MNSVRLLSLDFDGTLVRDWAPPPFPQVLVDIMTALRRRNSVLFALNTGRSLALMEHGLESTGFPIWPDFALTTEREVSAGLVLLGKTSANGILAAQKPMTSCSREWALCWQK